MKLIRLLSIPVLLAALSAVAQAPSRWAQPAAALADQVSAILGPGQVRFTLRNLSTIPADQLPAIQILLEQDLKAHGIVSAGDDSANALRITLSENASERLWIAEIVEGKETQVAMVHRRSRSAAACSACCRHHAAPPAHRHAARPCPQRARNTRRSRHARP